MTLTSFPISAKKKVLGFGIKGSRNAAFRISLTLKFEDGEALQCSRSCDLCEFFVRLFWAPGEDQTRHDRRVLHPRCH